MRIRWDERGLAIYVESDKTVFAADAAGRLFQVTTPQGSWLRDRYNRWFRLRHRPIPHRIPELDEAIQTRLQNWKEMWKRVLTAIRLKEDMDDVRKILCQWIEAFTEYHEADAVRFRQTYVAIPILPPDAYGAIYVRVHQGCRWNRCTFCSFYRKRPYRVLDTVAFREHLAAVKAYWGAVLRGRRGVFLGDAGAAGLPVGLLEDRLRILHSEFPPGVTENIHAFMDGFSPARRTVDEWRRLRGAGLKRISIGVESGDENQLKQWNKPLDRKALKTGIRRVLQAGIRINLIFLIGGSVLDPKRHLQCSLELIRHLGLGSGDRIYLSPIWEGGGWSEENFHEWTQWIFEWKEAFRSSGIRAGVHPYYLPRYLVA